LKILLNTKIKRQGFDNCLLKEKTKLKKDHSIFKNLKMHLIVATTCILGAFLVIGLIEKPNSKRSWPDSCDIENSNSYLGWGFALWDSKNSFQFDKLRLKKLKTGIEYKNNEIL